jgi:hypothetical protein
VTAAGARIWTAMADAETNGEREKARKAGQLGTCGSGCAVNKLRGKRCGQRNWLPERNPVQESMRRISSTRPLAPSPTFCRKVLVLRCLCANPAMVDSALDNLPSYYKTCYTAHERMDACTQSVCDPPASRRA